MGIADGSPCFLFVGGRGGGGGREYAEEGCSQSAHIPLPLFCFRLYSLKVKAETTGIFGGKECKSFVEQIRQRKKEVSERLTSPLAETTDRHRKTAAGALPIIGGLSSLISVPVFVSGIFRRLLL